MELQKFQEDIELTALTPAEMLTSQEQLIEWSDNKIASLMTDAVELQGAYEHAKKMKWKKDVHYRHWQKTLKRISYYEKIREALKAGYYIVPNFPIQMFAIRRDNETLVGYSTNYWGGDFSQHEQELKQGEGEYKNPWPIVERQQKITDKDGSVLQDSFSCPVMWDDFEFPVTMARPVIMKATSQAMALKIFDRIGIMPPASKKNDDPVIVGQIVLKQGYSTKVVSFMIAWHLNTNVL